MDEGRLPEVPTGPSPPDRPPRSVIIAGAARGRHAKMSNAVTRGIRIEVRSEYLPERSAPADEHYFFTYHVRISNEGTERARLVTREWIITDSNGEVQRVAGPGVVGEQPVLGPGESFEYSSFCPLKTSVGSMHGTYQMETDEGDAFDALIAPFTLAVPNALN